MSLQSETIGELVKALGAVMQSVGYVRGTGQNTHHKYSYTSDEDFATAVQPAMAEHGIAMVPTACTYDRQGDRVTVTQTWHVAHSSGEWMQMQMPGEGTDKQDKGTAKALTAARKYALRHLFCVPTGDDPEKEAKVNGEPEHTPFVSGLLDRIAALQSAGVQHADKAAGKILSAARAKMTDAQIKKAHESAISWVGAQESKIAGGGNG